MESKRKTVGVCFSAILFWSISLQPNEFFSQNSYKCSIHKLLKLFTTNLEHKGAKEILCNSNDKTLSVLNISLVNMQNIQHTHALHHFFWMTFSMRAFGAQFCVRGVRGIEMWQYSKKLQAASRVWDVLISLGQSVFCSYSVSILKKNLIKRQRRKDKSDHGRMKTSHTGEAAYTNIVPETSFLNTYKVTETY